MSQFVWTFPGGKKTIVKGTGVAGNVQTAKTVPAGKIWLLTNCNITMTTDATVANRYARLDTRDAADVIIFSNVGSALAASSGPLKYYFIWALTTTNSTRNALGFNLLNAGEDVVIQISAGVAGDAYDYLLEYLEIDAP